MKRKFWILWTLTLMALPTVVSASSDYSSNSYGCIPDMSPFVGQPYFDASAWGYHSAPYATGQMSWNGNYDGVSQRRIFDWPMVIASNSMRWYGAQPMGYSYLPPMGLSAIGASSLWEQMSPQWPSDTASVVED